MILMHYHSFNVREPMHEKKINEILLTSLDREITFLRKEFDFFNALLSRDDDNPRRVI